MIGGDNRTRKGEGMKIITLCQAGSCCPVVRIMDTHVEIGEDENTCILTIEQWETLKQRVREGSC
jgi:hypothetical protein